MPRVYSSCSDPHDFCRACFPTEAEAEERYGDVGDGPDGRGNCFGWDAEHPPYDGTGYRCTDCRAELGDDDDEA